MGIIEHQKIVNKFREKVAKEDLINLLRPLNVPQVDREDRLIPTSVGDSRVLIYSPRNRSADPLPVFVNFHGGGFVMNSAETDDDWCPVISERADCIVVNVDYRLAPENNFPVQLYECYDVVKWLYQNPTVLNVDPARIAVGGGSAGGNLSAAICLLARDRHDFSVIFQVLMYPVLDLAIDPFVKPKHEKALPPDLCKIFNECYVVSDEDLKNPLVSPLRADNLENLAPALIITAEYDALADEAELYAHRLQNAGIKVTYKKYLGAAHAFTHYGDLETAEDAWHLISDKLKEVFATNAI